VQLLHALARTSAEFDDPSLVSHAGLVPVMALAGRAGLPDLVAEHVTPGGECGVNARLKVPALVAGMAAGADSIDDTGVLRHGAMSALFGGIRAPSTLGSRLRSYTRGNLAQLEKAGRGFLAGLTRQAPLLRGADALAFIDIDSMQKRVYGHAKQGAKFGHARIAGKSSLVRGLNALAAVISTPIAAPVIAATRLRGGNAASARGAASLAAQAVAAARDCGCTATIIVRMDSACYSASVTGAIRRQGARFSVTVPVNSSVRAAIAEENWTAVRYPQAVRDNPLDCWTSDAEVAETGYTAFASRKKRAAAARLIVRRVRDQNKKAARGQGELFPAWRHHAVFTHSPFELVQAEAQHRRRGAGLRRRHQRPARPPAIRSLRRQRRTAAHRAHPPRPDRSRRPHRPPRQEQPRPPPPRRLAPRAGMAQPAGRSLRPARRSGLTSPDRPRTPRRPQATPNPSPEPGTTDKPQNRPAAGKPRPGQTRKPGYPQTAAPDNGRWIEAKYSSKLKNRRVAEAIARKATSRRRVTSALAMSHGPGMLVLCAVTLLVSF
jgi:hypothetical protein